ncbi:PQ loop repeat [Plasmodiophora brassicae]
MERAHTYGTEGPGEVVISGLGWASFALAIYAAVPPIVSNWRSKSTSLNGAFLMLWSLADAMLFIGAVLVNAPLTHRVICLTLCIKSIILFAQYVLYGRRRTASHVYSPISRKQTRSAIQLAAVTLVSTLPLTSGTFHRTADFLSGSSRSLLGVATPHDVVVIPSGRVMLGTIILVIACVLLIASRIPNVMHAYSTKASGIVVDDGAEGPVRMIVVTCFSNAALVVQHTLMIEKHGLHRELVPLLASSCGVLLLDMLYLHWSRATPKVSSRTNELKPIITAPDIPDV